MQNNFRKVAIWVVVIFLLLTIMPAILSSCFDSLGNVGWINDIFDDSSSKTRITDVDYKAVVTDEPDGRGKAVITELLTFNVQASSTYYLIYELWRALPEEYVDGVKVEYNVLSVRQLFDDGRPPLEYTESPKLYWYDNDYINTEGGLGPGKWFHSKGPYDGYHNFECVLFYVDGIYHEIMQFEVVYEMTNASLRYGDYSELYITLYSEETVHYLESFKAQILVPIEIMPREGNYYAHTYGTNSHTFPFTESTTTNPGYHTFAFELDKEQLQFRPYNEYIEFALISFGDDKHIFTQHAEVNHYFYDYMLHQVRQNQARYESLPAIFATARIVVLVVSIAISALTLVLSFNVDKRIRKKYTFHEPEMEIEFFREIPSELDPIFASVLVFCKHKPIDGTKDGYSAIMLDLVRKGYLELDRINSARDWSSNNIKIKIKNRTNTPPKFCTGCGKPLVEEDKFCPGCGIAVTIDSETPQLKPLTPTEEQYMNLILRHAKDSDISLRTLQERIAEDYQYSDSFVTAIKKVVKDIGLSKPMYFQNSDYKKPKNNLRSRAIFFIVLGILSVVAGNLISYPTRLHFAYGAFFILGGALIASAVFLLILSKKYILLTKHGETEYAKWRGLYNFLNSETLMNERTVVDLVLWEQYLVYATAFGISQKVIKALKIRCPEETIRNSTVLYNPYFRTRSFYSYGRTFRTTTRTASFSYRSGSHGSGGFGGGYGGGGRGGGGGGGGH